MNNKRADKSNRHKSTAENRTKNDTFSMQATKTDPQGSWTGVPENPDEKPVQDADDL